MKGKHREELIARAVNYKKDMMMEEQLAVAQRKRRILQKLRDARVGVATTLAALQPILTGRLSMLT